MPTRDRAEHRSTRTGGREPKRAYEPPAVLTVELKADEVLAVGCKLADGGGGPIIPNCVSGSCFSAGS